jgi:hypothetical protein
VTALDGGLHRFFSAKQSRSERQTLPEHLFGTPHHSNQEESAGHAGIVRKEGRSVALDKMGDFASAED